MFRNNGLTTSRLWFDQIIPVIFTCHFTGGDPFDNAQYEDDYGVIQAERERVTNRLNGIAEHLFAAQQRVCLFVILVIGRRFRLLRWDRAGIIATAPIDYVDNPSDFHHCLWRLSILDDTVLGFDPSATRIYPDDADHLRMDLAAMKSAPDVDHQERIPDPCEPGSPISFEYQRSLFRSTLSSDWPRYRLQVTDRDTTRDFLVGKPIFRASATAGRGTRGYVALDCKTRRFVWLKDTWRAAYAISSREGDALLRLNEAGVENVPTLVCHGDVWDQATVTTEWWERKHAPSGQSRCPWSAASLRLSSPTSVGSTLTRKRKREEGAADDVIPSQRSRRRARNLIADSNSSIKYHRHYRIVAEEVALPLRCFRNGQQLASIVLHVIQGKSPNATYRYLEADIRFVSTLPSSHKPTDWITSPRCQRGKYSHISEGQARQRRDQTYNSPDWPSCRLGAFETRGRRSGAFESQPSRAHGVCSILSCFD